METVHLRAHTTSQGRLFLDVPTSIVDAEVEVTITVTEPTDIPRDPLGWPIGFWQRFAGSISDFPVVEDLPA
jgi:hypothetical protein